MMVKIIISQAVDLAKAEAKEAKAAAEEYKRLHEAAKAKIVQVTDEMRTVRVEVTNNKIMKEAHDQR